MECTHSKTRGRTQERSALNRFLLHKYVLFNKSQSFILPCFWWRRTLPKSLRTKSHQQELSSSGVALPLLRGGGTCSPLGPLCPPHFEEGRTKEQESFPSFDHFSVRRIPFKGKKRLSTWGDASMPVQGFLSLVPRGPTGALRVFIPQAEDTSQPFTK